MYKALEPNNLVEDGTYQATIASVEVRDNFNKTDKQLTIEWKLSNGRVLFDRIGKDKDGSGEFNHYKIGLILYATGVKEVESNEDLISKLLGKTCEVTVTHLYSEAKKGRPTKEQVDFINAIRSLGGSAGVCWSVDDFLELIKAP